MPSPYVPYSPEWNNENISAPAKRISIAFIVVQTFFVCLFLVARYMKKTLMSLDVCFILLGYAWNLIIIAIIICLIQLGLGRHSIAVLVTSFADAVTALKFLFILAVGYLFAAAFPKLAILYLYHQLFSSRLYRRMAYAAGAVVIIGLLALCLGNFLVCRPLAYYWDRLLPGHSGKCGDVFMLYKLASLPNLLTDVAILVIPIPVVWKLKMRTSQKIGLTVTFLTGSFGIVTAVLRLYYFMVGNLFDDIFYNGMIIACWTIIEPSCYLIAAIMPSLRSFLNIVHESSIYASFRARSKSLMSWSLSRTTNATSTDTSGTTIIETNPDTVIKHTGEPDTEAAREYIIERMDGAEPMFVLNYHQGMGSTREVWRR